MSGQWLRNIQVRVGTAAGNAIDLSEMHIRFMVRNATVSTLKRAEITIYNLSPATAKQIQNEFTVVTLSVGYGDGLAQIFSGEIAIIKQGAENPADSFLYILAQDTDAAVNSGIINGTLAAGWTQQIAFSRIAKEWASAGVQIGYNPPLPATAAPRGKVLFGMTRDAMDGVAQASWMDWYIEDGQLNMLSPLAVLPGAPIKINSHTGMLGIPVQTVQGLEIRTPLSPRIRVGRLIQVDNAEVVQQRLVSRQFDMVQQQFLPSPAADGLYRVGCVTHAGDTRGEEWYSEAICTDVVGSLPNVSSPALQGVGIGGP